MTSTSGGKDISSSRKGVFFLSDQQLSERLQFIQEIGFGNWGSVWLCFPKAIDAVFKPNEDGRYPSKVAVKLVHRNKTTTNAARIRSLWNEIKVITSIKKDTHPSIVSFHSFILTSSYALIAMEYLPQLIPVEVAEPKARKWFRALLSAVEFLHEHGVVHNDIKPANILLSRQRIPVFVDFGFAENYDLGSDKAFLSSISYGTPEYLSPERARGNLHDTRKSDIWSLGITFFEILIGRTPFEYTEGEQFATKEDLEEYWNRTIKGKWVGEWDMSKSCEKMLKKMIAPNADLRYTASRAMNDNYWIEVIEQRDTIQLTHKNDSIKSRIKSQCEANRQVKQGLHIPIDNSDPSSMRRNQHRIPSVLTYSSSNKPITSSKSKENLVVSSDKANWKAGITSLPSLGLLSPTPKLSVIRNDPEMRNKTARAKTGRGKNKAERVLTDITNLSKNIDQSKVDSRDKITHKKQPESTNKSRDRVQEFEQLKQLEKKRMIAEDTDFMEDDSILAEGLSYLQNQTSTITSPPPTAWREHQSEISNRLLQTDPSILHTNRFSINTQEGLSLSLSERHSFVEIFEGERSPSKESTGLGRIRRSVKSSLDKSLRLYKSSTLYDAGWFSNNSPSAGENISRPSLNVSQHEPWEDDSLIRAAKSSLPVVRHAIHNEQVGVENRADRMTIWIRNVEQIVKETQENFASSNLQSLPVLPVRPVGRPLSQILGEGKSSRVPRRILPADQIFTSSDVTALSTMKSEYLTANDTINVADTPLPHNSSQFLSQSLRKGASATLKISTSDRTSDTMNTEDCVQPLSFIRPITPVANLQILIDQQEDVSPPVASLFDVLDRSVFVAGPTKSCSSLRKMSSIPTIPNESVMIKANAMWPKSEDSSQVCDIMSPPRSPVSNEQIEGAYDRFLMATSGVKRLGRGYQSNNTGPVSNTVSTRSYKRNPKFFHSARRMPPAVSSEDIVASPFSHELGLVSNTAYATIIRQKDDGYNTVKNVRNALKAFVSGKSLSRRQSGVL